jgi:hypothetical protein
MVSNSVELLSVYFICFFFPFGMINMLRVTVKISLSKSFYLFLAGATPSFSLPPTPNRMSVLWRHGSSRKFSDGYSGQIKRII